MPNDDSRQIDRYGASIPPMDLVDNGASIPGMQAAPDIDRGASIPPMQQSPGSSGESPPPASDTSAGGDG